MFEMNRLKTFDQRLSHQKSRVFKVKMNEIDKPFSTASVARLNAFVRSSMSLRSRSSRCFSAKDRSLNETKRK